jgi:hypothetical protein
MAAPFAGSGLDLARAAPLPPSSGFWRRPAAGIMTHLASVWARQGSALAKERLVDMSEDEVRPSGSKLSVEPMSFVRSMWSNKVGAMVESLPSAEAVLGPEEGQGRRNRKTAAQ